jgi:hypothetical protein
MKSVVLTFLLFFAVLITFAQPVFKVDSKNDADVKIFVANSKYDADLVVYEVESKYDATKDGLWFFYKFQI